MTDLAIIWTNGRGDIAQDGIDMLTDDSLTTDVTISCLPTGARWILTRCRMVQMIAVDGGVTVTATAPSVRGCGCYHVKSHAGYAGTRQRVCRRGAGMAENSGPGKCD